MPQIVPLQPSAQEFLPSLVARTRGPVSADFGSMTASIRLWQIVDLPRVFHHLHLVDVDIDEHAVALLYLPDVDVLNDVALYRVNFDRAAGAVEFLAFHEIDVFEPIGIGTLRCHR